MRPSPAHVRYLRIERVVLAALAVAVLVPTGCVRRRLLVRSNPSGAMVFVDNQQIGTTPCSVDFIYYGTREIRLVKAGFETLTVNQPIPAPWYQIPPIDFVSENLLPTKIEDHRTVMLSLQPQVIVPTEQLLDRANQLRQETLQGAVMPASATIVPNASGPVPIPLPPTTIPMIGPTLSPTVPPSTFSTAPADPFAPAPFSPVPFAPQPVVAPLGPQQGPPIVSPPLR